MTDAAPAGPAGPDLPTVAVGPFRVADLGVDALVQAVVDRALAQAGTRPTRVFALHVGGLNERSDRRFVAAMERADVVYADGGSVVLVARLAGGRRMQRAATTDVGWDVLRTLAARLGRAPRLALVGGPYGLAEAAGKVLEDGGAGQVVLAENGYQDDWEPVLDRLRAAAPDVLVVGLGAPAEMVWVDTHAARLPPALVLTSGGWFGHLIGNERRAPRMLRRPGLEWVARFAQAPARLGPRYARGLVSTARLAVAAPLSRRSLPR